MMDLKHLEQEELKEETTLDMSHQRIVNDVQENPGDLTVQDQKNIEDNPEEAAVVGLGEEESSKEDNE